MYGNMYQVKTDIPLMVVTAIENAKFHGINVHHGVPNNASGDCAFEAVADNISYLALVKSYVLMQS